MTKVLIVEDNPESRDILGRRLEQLGYSIHFAEDGPSGIELASEHMPDVIPLTASAFDSDREKSFAAGCCDFDTKPVDLLRLLGKIEKSLASAA